MPESRSRDRRRRDRGGGRRRGRSARGGLRDPDRPSSSWRLPWPRMHRSCIRPPPATSRRASCGRWATPTRPSRTPRSSWRARSTPPARSTRSSSRPAVSPWSATTASTTVWTPHQAPHRARFTLARLFGIPANRVRVVVPTVGGAFGKNDALTAEPYAVAASLLTGRPVRLLFPRTEDFVGTESRHATRTTLAMAIVTTARSLALRGRTIVDAGAYLSHSAAINAVIPAHLVASYRIEHADLEGIVVFTNTPVSGAFRGYGGPQASLPHGAPHRPRLCAARGRPDRHPAANRRRPEDPWGQGGARRPTGIDGSRGGAAPSAGSRAPRPRTPSRRRRGEGMASPSGRAGSPARASTTRREHPIAPAAFAVLSPPPRTRTGIRTTLGQICADMGGHPVTSVVGSETPI